MTKGVNMQQIKSTYLNVNFNVDIFPGTDEHGGSVSIIKHSSLEDILLNQLPNIISSTDIKIQWKIEPLFVSSNFASFLFIIEDSTGRKIMETGETSMSYLKTDIDKKNLVRIAKNRAIDTGLIKYLAFPLVDGKYGRIFSNAEDLEGINQHKNFQTHPESTSNTVNLTNFTDPAFDTSNIYVADPIDWSQYIIHFGQFRGYSINELYGHAKSREWLLKAAKHLQDGSMDSLEGQKQFPDIRRFLCEKGAWHDN